MRLLMCQISSIFLFSQTHLFHQGSPPCIMMIRSTSMMKIIGLLLPRILNNILIVNSEQINFYVYRKRILESYILSTTKYQTDPL